MLTWNKWQAAGLINGLIGTVVEIIYADNMKPPQLPMCVLVKFEEKHPNGEYIYRGESLSPYYDEQIVAITPETSYFWYRGKYCSRTQLPLGLCYACTIHKIQGSTQNRLHVDIFDEDPNGSAGMGYTALSRCREIDNMAIVPFDRERFTKLSKMRAFAVRKTELKRLHELFVEIIHRYAHMNIPQRHTLQNISSFDVPKPLPPRRVLDPFVPVPQVEYANEKGFHYNKSLYDALQSLGINYKRFKNDIQDVKTRLFEDVRILRDIVQSKREIFEKRKWHFELWKKAKLWYSQANPENSDSMADENVDMDEEICLKDLNDSDVQMGEAFFSANAEEQENDRSFDSSSDYSSPANHKKVKHFI